MPTQVIPAAEEIAAARRRLILHDSLAFLSLTLATLALLTVTLLLFRSFTAHRDDLARRWSARGGQALRAGKPDEAIVALRTALTYAPGTRADELLLAQALGAAGHIDESTTYFMGLWEAQPGNGFINLQLARLAARRNDRADAVNFYRASIYGTWEGDAIQRRADGRLELARYLISIRDLAPARMELLIAGSNAPANPGLAAAIAPLLTEADDPADAADYYAKALAAQPKDAALLNAAALLAYQTGDYERALKLFAREQALHPLAADDQEMVDIARLTLEPVPSPVHHRRR